MSAGSDTTAIVSLGMSCQSARQIRTSIEVLSEVLAQAFQPERHFFDGLVAPVAGLAQLFEDGFPLFDRVAIVDGPGHPTWNPYEIRFLHHFRPEPEAAADIDGWFENELSRFTHLRAKFERLRQRERLIFVISNSQNNLDLVARDTGIEKLDFDADELKRLQVAVDGFFGRACEYLVVSHPERHGGTELPELRILQADDSEWTGDKRQWRELFRDYLAKGRVEPFAV
ncbi:hypothetical protein J0X15_11415 [Roseibium sp. CAU 1637]|uniref:Uncharacterized protein n=1 Tax=Roseibium limicola TaxID=2816037 RepID=A0A939ERL7_9HYPH|nr:hypothetical protein [Roseibium limicola]MBO0345829.1 hypothetical protein [Roseibium limicola]